jgi:hypothetical protein
VEAFWSELGGGDARRPVAGAGQVRTRRAGWRRRLHRRCSW